MSRGIISSTDNNALAYAVALLNQHQVIVMPSDTLYCLAANVFDKQAVSKVYALKARSLDKPSPIFIPNIDYLDQITTGFPAYALPVIEQFWPGALTLVLNKKPHTFAADFGHEKTIAVRIPNHPFCQALLNAIQQPLTSTSANLTGQPTPLTAEEIEQHFRGEIPLIVDGGTSQSNLPSTILDLTADRPVMLREGAISFARLRELLPHLILKAG